MVDGTGAAGKVGDWMKGIINKGLQEFLTSRFGADVWESIKQRAGCEEPFFSASQDYPDELTSALARAAAELTGLPEETILVEFGKHWVPQTGARAYPQFFQLAGATAREFLLNMDKIHQHVTRSLGSPRPPRFHYEDLPDGRLRIHYRSDRRLCPVLRGLILGVGIHFGEEIEVEEIACTEKGDEVCIMEVRFHAA